MNFIRANTVLVVGDHPHGNEPFIQAKQGIFKDRANFDAELAMIVNALALPPTLVFQKHNVSAATCRANNAIGPAMSNQIGQAIIGVGKVEDDFL
jgi:hypothetical protein